MWIRTAKHHINTDKIEHTEVLPTGAIRLVFQYGNFIVLKGSEALEMITYLDSISTPSWSLVPELNEETKE